MPDLTTANVARIPDCDICKFEDGIPHVAALYDMKTNDGRWGYVCEAHFRSHTNRQLGTGKGQRLVLVEGDTK